MDLLRARGRISAAMPVHPGRLAVLVLAVAGSGTMSTADTRPDRVGRADGIGYTIPAGWHAAKRSLTPHLVNPHEVLTVGTGSLPRGGRCAHSSRRQRSR